MVPSKLLIGSVVGVGSVSTAAVVAHQHGFFSTTNQSQETSDTPVADTLEVPEARDQDNTGSDPNVPQPDATVPVAPPALVKTKKDEIKEWLESDTETKTWTIKIKKSEQQTEDFKNDLIQETDLQGLIDYLKPNIQLFKSFVSSLDEKTLTFENATGGWKCVLTITDVEKWVKTISKSNATLKLATKEGKEKKLTDVKEPHKLLKDLFKEKGIFEKTTEPKKNILFEKDSANDWKHSKTEITNWLAKDGDNKFSVMVQKGSENKKLNETDEENLIGLLKYLKDKKSELFEFTKDSNTLTFKKENSGWEVIHSETTINNWVSNVAGTQTTLELYEGTGKKTPEASEWKTLLGLIKGEKTLFEKSTNQRKIIFEKDGTWKHIKKAIEDWLKDSSGGKDKLTIQIQKDNKTKLDWNNSEVKDEDLIGLLSHLKGTSYIPTPETAEKTLVTLQKKSSSNNEWEQVTTTPVAS